MTPVRAHVAWRRATMAATAATAATLLSACTSAPPRAGSGTPPATAPATPSALALPAALARFESTQRERARDAQREGLWLEARQHWAVVLALKPDDTEAQAAWAQAEQAARSAAQDRARRAEQARARGEVEAAMRLNLEALAHDPGLPGPADALRTMERERALRALPRAFAQAPSPPRPNPELEHAELLAAEGEIDAALAVLEPMARAPRADAALKRRVCELLLRVADTQTPPAAALATVQRCLRLLPQHPQALQHPKGASGATSTTSAPGR